jgi:hypothetical protein
VSRYIFQWACEDAPSEAFLASAIQGAARSGCFSVEAGTSKCSAALLSRLGGSFATPAQKPRTHKAGPRYTSLRAPNRLRVQGSALTACCYGIRVLFLLPQRRQNGMRLQPNGGLRSAPFRPHPPKLFLPFRVVAALLVQAKPHALPHSRTRQATPGSVARPPARRWEV